MPHHEDRHSAASRLQGVGKLLQMIRLGVRYTAWQTVPAAEETIQAGNTQPRKLGQLLWQGEPKAQLQQAGTRLPCRPYRLLWEFPACIMLCESDSSPATCSRPAHLVHTGQHNHNMAQLQGVLLQLKRVSNALQAHFADSIDVVNLHFARQGHI